MKAQNTLIEMMELKPIKFSLRLIVSADYAHPFNLTAMVIQRHGIGRTVFKF